MKEYTHSFITLVYNDCTEILKKEIEKNKDKFGKEFFDNFFNAKPKKSVRNKISFKEDFLIYKLFYPISEIQKSIDVINITASFIRTKNIILKRLPKKNYYEYHISNYFNELYIIRERLVSFINIIKKVYKTERNSIQIINELNDLKEQTIIGFKTYCKIRGEHIHGKRFNDNDLSDLNYFELLIKNNRKLKITIGDLINSQYVVIANKWYRKTVIDRKNLYSFFDLYFNKISQIILENGKIRIPRNL